MMEITDIAIDVSNVKLEKGEKRDPKRDEKRDPKNDEKIDPKKDDKNDEKIDPKNDEKRDPKNDEKRDLKKDEKIDPKRDEKRDLKKDEKIDPKRDEKIDPKRDEKIDPKKDEKRDPKNDEKRDLKKDEKRDLKKDEKRDPKNDEKRDLKKDEKRDPKKNVVEGFEGGLRSPQLRSPQNIYCNLLVIDNFYNNALETRNFVLTQDFMVRGNYPGQRTVSHATPALKTMIEGYIHHFAGKIIQWPMEKESYNGAFQYTTSRDRTWIHNDSWNNWAAVLYLTPNAPVTSGTGIYRFEDGTRTSLEAEAYGKKAIMDKYSQDYTKWELVDRIGNIFNRMILFNAKQYHASQDYFGTTKEDGRLFQVFFFTTER